MIILTGKGCKIRFISVRYNCKRKKSGVKRWMEICPIKLTFIPHICTFFSWNLPSVPIKSNIYHFNLSKQIFTLHTVHRTIQNVFKYPFLWWEWFLNYDSILQLKIIPFLRKDPFLSLLWMFLRQNNSTSLKNKRKESIKRPTLFMVITTSRKKKHSSRAGKSMKEKK